LIGIVYKKLIILGCFLLLAPPCLYADDLGQTLESLKEKESYSIGYQVGLSMMRDGVEVDIDILIQGLQDAISEKDPILSNEEMRGIIVARKERAREASMQKQLETRAKNAEESQKFLAENVKKQGNMTTESGLQYKILKAGEGISPESGDTVTVHYKGTFIDGEEFDSSYSKGEPQTFQVNRVIKGWTEALQMMKVGAKWKIFLPPRLAYGQKGDGETIPPNKVLVFEIELLSVEDTGEKQDKG
jgi:FKBP-type peptidyl-prolyl cis-trans isomerase FklB